MAVGNISQIVHVSVLKRAAAAIALLALSAAPAFSQNVDSLTITDTGEDAQGRIAINAAAGDLNQQANQAVIAEGENALIFTTNVVQQNLEHNTVTPSDSESAKIVGDSFSGASGAIAINGVAGTENQQANLAVFGIGIEGAVVSLEALSQSRSSQEPAGDLDVPMANDADIDPLAFTDASGLVQVNLTAGERNSSANLFGLTFTGGTD